MGSRWGCCLSRTRWRATQSRTGLVGVGARRAHRPRPQDGAQVPGHSARRLRRASGGWPCAGAALDALWPRDQDLAYELWLKQALLDHARRFGQARGEPSRIVDGAEIVGDEATVPATAHLSQARLTA